MEKPGVLTLVYSEENEIFNLKFRLGYNSIIEFSQNEEIETISLGDPYPWKITPVDRRLFIKPIEAGVTTNMTVITNERVYLFEIEAELPPISDESSNTYISVVKFYYSRRQD